jgi:uncharacterized membrane protein
MTGNLMGVALMAHVLSAIIWVGGMFFAWMILRPVAASHLEPPDRLKLWKGVFDRFFPWVWASVGLILASGFWIILGYYQGFANVGPHVHTMTLLGITMTIIYLVVYFVPYPRLRAAVEAGNWPEGARHLALIRRLIGINLLIGLLTAAVAVSGRYLM